MEIEKKEKDDSEDTVSVSIDSDVMGFFANKSDEPKLPVNTSLLSKSA